VPSGVISALITEVEQAVAWAADAAAKARGRALDPVLAASQVAAAHREMEDAAFRGERLQAAVTKLRERLEQVKAQEEDERRRLAYEKAKADRDRLAEELARVYPPIAAQLADLLTRIDANDREIEHINAHALPSGAERLLVAELVARGLEGFVKNSMSIPQITKQLRLPPFKFNVHEPYAWPRPQ
jgi:hypothetical protein